MWNMTAKSRILGVLLTTVLPKGSLLPSLGAVFAAALFLVACATNPDVRWAQAQQAYNSANQIFIDLRAPCVDIGPDDPGCIIDDQAYNLIDPIFVRARAMLDKYDETKSIEWLDIAEGIIEEARAATLRAIQ